MDFFRQDAQLEINPEHYEPSFIAKDVDELSRNAGTRQALRQYKILEDGPEEQEESHIDPKATKTKEQQDAGSKKEKDMYSDKMNRSEERKSGDNKSRDSTERPGMNNQSKDFDRGSSDKSREMLRAQKQDAGDKDGRSSAQTSGLSMPIGMHQQNKIGTGLISSGNLNSTTNTQLSQG